MNGGPPLRVMVAGAGVAALEALLALRALAGERVDLTVIEPRDELALHVRAGLRTGRGALWLQRDLDDEDDPGNGSCLPLWAPPGKIAIPELGGVLAARDRGLPTIARPLG